MNSFRHSAREVREQVRDICRINGLEIDHMMNEFECIRAAYVI